jgi:hypothetical protein
MSPNSNSGSDDGIDHVTTLVALDGVDPESLDPEAVKVLRDHIYATVEDLDTVEHDYLDVVVKDENGVRL